ncbi:unnamed protein product [Durusdinium trenchii]|uniref:Uncharacterized protein n=1 Tax=Durusdinium trenchii TaxID=1381693 RepID=A0ABP0PC05_9DINO
MPFAPSFDRLEFTDRSAMDLLIYALLAWCAIDVRGEKLTTMDLKRAIQREGVVNAAKAKLRALDGGVCPKSFPRILRGFDYGIGCAFVEKNLAGVEGKGCRCPSVLDVCATQPRFRSVRHLPEELTRLTVPELGYCRTGAWVFALGGMLLLGALGGTAVLLKRRSRVDVSRREAGHTPAKAAVA